MWIVKLHFDMKNRMLLVFFLFCLSLGLANENESWIRINNLRYLPQSIKVAVLGSKAKMKVTSFALMEAVTGKQVYSSKKITPKGAYGPFESSFRSVFSDFENTGRYFIQVNAIESPVFDVNADVYD